MIIKKKIEREYKYRINIKKSGQYAIIISARCKSRKQTKAEVDEDLRVEINRARFREVSPKKYVQLYNIPPAFNGSKLRGSKKTVIFLTVLKKGEQVISLVPRPSAFIEEISVKEYIGKHDVNLKIEETAEDGNNVPWYSFVLLDLPLRSLTIEASLKRRYRDSDDIKIIIDEKIKRNKKGGKYKYWYWAAGLLGWVMSVKNQKYQTQRNKFTENLDEGTHYIEIWSDRMPVLHSIEFDIRHSVTESEIRAEELVRYYSSLIMMAAREFEVDPVIVAAVIYQEQATNVNFIDALTDYLGGLLGLNTSIGIGQIRVETAELLEREFPQLGARKEEGILTDIERIERLKDPFSNIKYVTAKIRFSQQRWAGEGYDIKTRPEILGTLYNIEDINRPIKPHLDPKPNDFGEGVQENYEKVKLLLGV